jgi:hypothetical protein
MEHDLASPSSAAIQIEAEMGRSVYLPLSPDDLDVILCVLRHGPAARVEFEAEREMAQAVEEALAAGFKVVPTRTLDGRGY